VLTDGAVRTVSGKLFQMRGAVELKARRLAKTMLSVGWESIYPTQSPCLEAWSRECDTLPDGRQQPSLSGYYCSVAIAIPTLTRYALFPTQVF